METKENEVVHVEVKQETGLPYASYAEVPWYRKNWLLILSALFCWPVAIVLLWTGNVYYVKNKKLTIYGMGQKIAITIWAIIMCGYSLMVLSPTLFGPSIEDQAQGLMDRILKEQLFTTNTCIKVKTVEKVTPKFYKAKAYISNGSELEISITLDPDAGTIFVSVPNQ